MWVSAHNAWLWAVEFHILRKGHTDEGYAFRSVRCYDSNRREPAWSGRGAGTGGLWPRALEGLSALRSRFDHTRLPSARTPARAARKMLIRRQVTGPMLTRPSARQEDGEGSALGHLGAGPAKRSQEVAEPLDVQTWPGDAIYLPEDRPL